VLVHCSQGINRSGVIVAAYLMLHERLPVLQVVQLCASKRHAFLWNDSFQEQLIELAWHHSLLGAPQQRTPTQRVADVVASASVLY
jgi:protein-tyrosine phosphatase